MKCGQADLPLHYGTIPPWLAQRMALLGGAIVEAIVMEYGKKTPLQLYLHSFVLSNGTPPVSPIRQDFLLLMAAKPFSVMPKSQRTRDN